MEHDAGQPPGSSFLSPFRLYSRPFSGSILIGAGQSPPPGVTFIDMEYGSPPCDTVPPMRCPFLQTRPLVLASSSPRRQDFLRDQGLDFRILPARKDEVRPEPGEAPEAYALRTARSKACAVRAELAHMPPQIPPQMPARSENPPGSPLVLAADTIVVLDGDILGKPASRAEALAMLERLAGRAHTVTTACCLWFTEEAAPRAEFADSTRVSFAPWPRELLAAYAATGDPLDKAGAYGMQGRGAFLVERIEGSWSTVVGLPVDRVIRALLDCGVLLPPRGVSPRAGANHHLQEVSS